MSSISNRKRKALHFLKLLGILLVIAYLTGLFRPLPSMVVRDVERHYAMPHTEIIHSASHKDLPSKRFYLSRCTDALLFTAVEPAFPAVWTTVSDYYGGYSVLPVAEDKISAAISGEWGGDHIILIGFVPDGMNAPTFVIQQLYSGSKSTQRYERAFEHTPELTIPSSGGTCFLSFIPVTYADRSAYNGSEFYLKEGDPSLMSGIEGIDSWFHWADP